MRDAAINAAPSAALTPAIKPNPGVLSSASTVVAVSSIGFVVELLPVAAAGTVTEKSPEVQVPSEEKHLLIDPSHPTSPNVGLFHQKTQSPANFYFN